MKKIKTSLFIKLALLILCSTGLVLLVVTRINNQAMRNELVQNQQALYTALASGSAKEIELFFTTVAQAVDSAAIRLKQGELSAAKATDETQKILLDHPNIYGAAVAMAPNLAEPYDFKILYTSRQAGTIKTQQRINIEHDYQSDWFYLPYHLKRSTWSDLYFDADVQEMMITYSVPVMEKDEVLAVVTCDVSLHQILAMFNKLQFSGSTRAMLLNRFGRILAHPNSKWVMTETLYSLREAMTDPEQQATMSLLQELVRSSQPGALFGQRTVTGDIAWIYCQPVEGIGWQ
jgi:sigma-B regulation protein RsbU (phosphoserine phosphatase)